MAEVTRDSIRAFKGHPLKPVEVPEWGGTVYIRVMPGTERDSFEAETYKLNGKSVELNRANFRARLLVRTLTDKDGRPLYHISDADELGQQPADILDKLATVASQANGMSPKDVEDLAKN